MGNLLTTSSTLMCPHGGSVSATSSNSVAKADGSPIVRGSDTFTISGCPFVLGNTPHPCVRVQWTVTATMHKAAGQLALTSDSAGLCLAADSAPQGPVQISNTQMKVKGV
ncbi:MAG: hypothetical protein JWN02_778 [Acidobacteria bacterium]|jgi:hypothetical protein|nr:hypothetical protein [Acidobacteriota bacterium]